MLAKRTIAAIAVLAGCTFAAAQQIAQTELKVDSTNRTLTVSATGSVSVEPDSRHSAHRLRHATRGRKIRLR